MVPACYRCSDQLCCLQWTVCTLWLLSKFGSKSSNILSTTPSSAEIFFVAFLARCHLLILLCSILAEFYCLPRMDENEQLAYMESAMPENCEMAGDLNFQRWIYTMRREMQEILPGVWLGPYASAMKRNESQLNQVGITHIILVRGPNEAYFIRPHFPERIQYLTLEISDKPSQNIIQYFRKVCQFIDQCLAQNGKVLVHGISGISRSASLIIAYVMMKRRSNFDEAYRYVQQRRFCIHPNDSFKRQLGEFEPIYLAQMINQPTIYENRDLKRPFEEEFDQPM